MAQRLHKQALVSRVVTMASLKETDRNMAREDVQAHAQTARGAREPGAKAPGAKEPGAKEPEEKRLSAAETIHESAVSHDKPMERKAPEAPFALVGLAYFAVLAIVGLIVGIVLFALS